MKMSVRKSLMTRLPWNDEEDLQTSPSNSDNVLKDSVEETLSSLSYPFSRD